MVSMHTGHSKRSLRNPSVEFWFVLEVAILIFDCLVVFWCLETNFELEMPNDRQVSKTAVT